MSDKDPKYELDDELLSAYIDDELSSAERAAVEARLAVEPAARQLLHELRSVSQSVQALPQETPGRDLSEEVVRRAREAKPRVVRGSPDPAQVSDRRSPTADGRETLGPIIGEVGRPAPNLSKAEPSGLGDAMPKVTIFGTTRAWVWASLALAAGLLVMVVQSGDESAKKLPPVAQNNDRSIANQPADESTRRLRESVSSSGSTLTSPGAKVTDNWANKEPTPPATPMLSQPSSKLRAIAKEAAPAVPPAAAASPALKRDDVPLSTDGRYGLAAGPGGPAGEPSIDALADQSQATGHESAVGGALSTGAGEHKAEPPHPESGLVVVHVVVKRAALEHKLFDEVLRGQDISVEPQAPQEQPPGLAGGRIAKQEEREFAIKRLSDKTDSEQNADLVFVEAPRPAIESCLAALNQDSGHYSGIEIDDRRKASDGADAKAASKKVVEELSKYNRGTVSQRQKDGVRRSGGVYYYDANVPNKNLGDESSPGDVSGTEKAVQQDRYRTETLAGKRLQKEYLGRAWRIPVLKSEEQTITESAGSASAGAVAMDKSKLAPLQAKLKAPAQPEAENLKVLFVLSPEDAAPSSAPPTNRTK